MGEESKFGLFNVTKSPNQIDYKNLNNYVLSSNAFSGFNPANSSIGFNQNNDGWFGTTFRGTYGISGLSNVQQKQLFDMANQFGVNKQDLINWGQTNPNDFNRLLDVQATGNVGQIQDSFAGVKNAITQQKNSGFGSISALDWGKLGLQAAGTLYGIYSANQGMKLARQNFEEQRALNRANYRNQARAFNNSLRDQQSGRGYVGMSGAAKRVLGQEYDRRKANEDY